MRCAWHVRMPEGDLQRASFQPRSRSVSRGGEIIDKRTSSQSTPLDPPTHQGFFGQRHGEQVASHIRAIQVARGRTGDELIFDVSHTFIFQASAREIPMSWKR